jgi:hypothetical protein
MRSTLFTQDFERLRVIFSSVCVLEREGGGGIIRLRVKRFVSLQFLRQSIGLLGRDQPVARPLPTQDNTNTVNADIHALSGIRTHDSSARASEDSSCLRERGHCVRQDLPANNMNIACSVMEVNLE